MESSSTEQNEPARPQFHEADWVVWGPLNPRTPSATYAHQLAQLEERRQAELETERAHFWFWVKVALLCILSCIAGLIPMAWALHTTDIMAGHAAWQFGKTLGPALVVIVLIGAWLKRESQGE